MSAWGFLKTPVNIFTTLDMAKNSQHLFQSLGCLAPMVQGKPQLSTSSVRIYLSNSVVRLEFTIPFFSGGDLTPDFGDVFINGVSVVHHPSVARGFLGVCPQFTAIDAHLTVRQHLRIYGRLKGLRRGQELDTKVQALMRATTLDVCVDWLANKLSNGNQRKLALAIALISNFIITIALTHKPLH